MSVEEVIWSIFQSSVVGVFWKKFHSTFFSAIFSIFWGLSARRAPIGTPPGSPERSEACIDGRFKYKILNLFLEKNVHLKVRFPMSELHCDQQKTYFGQLQRICRSELESQEPDKLSFSLAGYYRQYVLFCLRIR